jgi:DNA-binding CsgD family transcriptional regulator
MQQRKDMEQLDRIEWKLDQIMAVLAQSQTATAVNTSFPAANGEGHLQEERTLEKFTTKQHAALQMLMRGADNKEIALRFGVSINTAKVYVRTIAKKLKVHTRAQIIYKMMHEFQDVDENAYMIMSGGLPKDWDSNFSTPDPFARLYTEKKNEPTSVAS